jgi:hypothetical protein
MNTQLITSWSEHDSHLQQILGLATKTLCIFDQDLSKLRLEQPDKIESLRRLLSASRQNLVTVFVRNAEPIRRDCPRLMKLLSTYPQTMTLFECPSHLSSLSDSMLIADDRHALVRFHDDHARCKAILDNTDECVPYVVRLKEIAKEGGEQVFPTPLGL